jgi:hypothetical protein
MDRIELIPLVGVTCGGWRQAASAKQLLAVPGVAAALVSEDRSQVTIERCIGASSIGCRYPRCWLPKYSRLDHDCVGSRQWCELLWWECGRLLLSAVWGDVEYSPHHVLVIQRNDHDDE